MSGTPEYIADVETFVGPFMRRWDAMLGDHSLPFHSAAWMRAWYSTLGVVEGRKPLLVGVKRSDTGKDVMLLPLIQRRWRGLSLVEFADAGVVDYVSPLLTADWAPGPADDVAARSDSARRLWRAVREALTGHDVFRADKMLGKTLEECPENRNPLLLALRAETCEMYGNQFHVSGSWDDWLVSLGKNNRRNLVRCWRAFSASEAARFERVTDLAEALEVFARMEAQQNARMARANTRYFLDRAEYRAFYRQALTEGLADGSVVLTVLRDGEHLVAAQFGIANRSRYIALRQTMQGGQWYPSSPGRLLNEKTAYHLFESGLRWFDFGIGDYRHKRAFRVSHIPLHDVCEALSWRGVPVLWGWRLRRALKRQAWLVAFWRRLKGDATGAPGTPDEAQDETAAPARARS